MAARGMKAEAAGITTQIGFERVIAEMATVRLAKVIEYGEERYETERWTEQEELWMIYSDVYRKFIRLRQQVRSADTAGMRETLMDLANYGAMGVQLIDRRNESV